MKLLLGILGMLIASNLLCYDYIGKFNGGRAIVKEADKWGIVDSSYNEYFFSSYIMFSGKKYKIKEINDFFNIKRSKYIKDSPVNDGFICKIILEETVLNGINKFLYATIDGNVLKIKDFMTDEHLQSTMFLTNSESNRYANNWIFQISNPSKYKQGIFEFNTYYLDADTNGIVSAYQIFSAGQYNYIGASQQENINYSDIRIPVAKDNNWGYVDGEGTRVIDLNFKFTFSFHNEVGVVIKETGLYSFVNLDGKLSNKEFELLGSFNSSGEAIFLKKMYSNPELHKKNPRAPNDFFYTMGIVNRESVIIKELKDCQPLLDLGWLFTHNADLFIKHYKSKYTRKAIEKYWNNQQLYKTFKTVKSDSDNPDEEQNLGSLIGGLFESSTEDYKKQYTLLTNYTQPLYFYPLRDGKMRQDYINFIFKRRFSNYHFHAGIENGNTIAESQTSSIYKINPLDLIWKFVAKDGKIKLYANLLKKTSNSELITVDENLKILDHDPVFYPNEDGIVTYKYDLDLFDWSK